MVIVLSAPDPICASNDVSPSARIFSPSRDGLPEAVVLLSEDFEMVLKTMVSNSNLSLLFVIAALPVAVKSRSITAGEVLPSTKLVAVILDEVPLKEVC
jgi:hypothetical protein